MQLVGELFANLGKVIGWNDGRRLQFAGTVAVEFRHLLRNDVVPHDVDRRIRRVPVLLVAVQLEQRSGLPPQQHIGAVG